MEVWHRVIPFDDFFPVFHIDTVLNKAEGYFALTLKDENYTRKMTVIFEHCMATDKITKRAVFLKKIEELNQSNSKDFCNSWSFFRVENSDYLEWFKTQSFGIYENQKEGYEIKHYVFMGSNFVMEIIAPGMPIIKMEDR